MKKKLRKSMCISAVFMDLCFFLLNIKLFCQSRFFPNPCKEKDSDSVLPLLHCVTSILVEFFCLLLSASGSKTVLLDKKLWVAFPVQAH